MRGHTNPNGYLADYCDGNQFKHHPLFSSQSTALQIMLYYDELEVSNPLGTKTKVHKLGQLRNNLVCTCCLFIQEYFIT